MTPHIEPDPYSSAEYHLYKLENLFQTLHDLWEAKRQGARVGHRWLLALTGFSGKRAVPETPNAFPITLEVGSRICNTAIEALVHNRSRSPQSTHHHYDRIEADIRYMRELLIALHDFTETNGPREDYPLEHETARTLLAMLIDKPPESGDDDLFDTSFARGQKMATNSIELMQQAN